MQMETYCSVAAGDFALIASCSVTAGQQVQALARDVAEGVAVVVGCKSGRCCHSACCMEAHYFLMKERGCQLFI